MRDVEKHKAARKAWRAKNPDKEKAYAKKNYERRKNDPEYIAKERAYHAKWQKENKDKWNAYIREWRRKKREKNCPKCKHFAGCEKAYNGVCNLYEEVANG